MMLVGANIMQTNLTIGQVAREAGVAVETVRFYEREGLLEEPIRRTSGYRQFDQSAVARLRFVKQAQRLGFTLREIKDLLALKLDPESTRAGSRACRGESCRHRRADCGLEADEEGTLAAHSSLRWQRETRRMSDPGRH